MHLLFRDLIKDTQLVKESRKRQKKKKSSAPAGFEPMTSRVLLRRRVLYCSATIAVLNHLEIDLATAGIEPGLPAWKASVPTIIPLPLELEMINIKTLTFIDWMIEKDHYEKLKGKRRRKDKQMIISMLVRPNEVSLSSQELKKAMRRKEADWLKSF